MLNEALAGASPLRAGPVRSSARAEQAASAWPEKSRLDRSAMRRACSQEVS